MTTLAASPSAPPASSTATAGAGAAGSLPPRTLAAIAALVLAAFGGYSMWVVYGHGYTGFLSLAGDEPWAMQMLLDLGIAVVFAIGWMRADARKRGLAIWPYVLTCICLGSIGLLAYAVRRGLAGRGPAR